MKPLHRDRSIMGFFSGPLGAVLLSMGQEFSGSWGWVQLAHKSLLDHILPTRDTGFPCPDGPKSLPGPAWDRDRGWMGTVLLKAGPAIATHTCRPGVPKGQLFAGVVRT